MTAPPPDDFPSFPSFPSVPLGTPPPGCPAHVEGSGQSGGATRLYGPEASADPMGLYERLRAEHGAVAPVLLEGDAPAWLVLGYDEVLHVARNSRRFTRDARQWRDWHEGRVTDGSPLAPVLAWGPGCLHQDGSEHRRLREAVNASLERFDRRGIRRHVSRYGNLLIDDFVTTGRADILRQYAQQLPMLVLTRLIGLPERAGPALVEASSQLLAGTEKAVASDQYIQGTLRQLVADKHVSPGSDLASWLIEHPAKLTDEEIAHHLRLVMVAANETTTNLIVNTLRMVLTHPRFRGTLNGGQMTLPAAVEQVLWDEPPLMVCPARFATYEMELAGKVIHKGDLLLLGLAAGNLDPAIRPDPAALMHANRSHLAFSAGPHECPGQDIGRAITGSGIEALLFRLPDVRLVVSPDELSWTSSTWSRHLNALPVRFAPQSVTAPDPPSPRPDETTPEPMEPAPVPRARKEPNGRWKTTLGRLVRR